MASQDDGVNQLRGLNVNLAQLVTRFTDAFPLSASQGTFTCAAAATTTVSDVHVKAASAIFICPTNAAAGTLMAGANSLYLSARTAGTSFAFSTAGGGAAAGTETFTYIVVNVG